MKISRRDHMSTSELVYGGPNPPMHSLIHQILHQITHLTIIPCNHPCPHPHNALRTCSYQYIVVWKYLLILISRYSRTFTRQKLHPSMPSTINSIIRGSIHASIHSHRASPSMHPLILDSKTASVRDIIQACIHHPTQSSPHGQTYPQTHLDILIYSYQLTTLYRYLYEYIFREKHLFMKRECIHATNIASPHPSSHPSVRANISSSHHARSHPS